MVCHALSSGLVRLGHPCVVGRSQVYNGSNSQLVQMLQPDFVGLGTSVKLVVDLVKVGDAFDRRKTARARGAACKEETKCKNQPRPGCEIFSNHCKLSRQENNHSWTQMNTDKTASGSVSFCTTTVRFLRKRQRFFNHGWARMDTDGKTKTRLVVFFRRVAECILTDARHSLSVPIREIRGQNQIDGTTEGTENTERRRRCPSLADGQRCA